MSRSTRSAFVADTKGMSRCGRRLRRAIGASRRYASIAEQLEGRVLLSDVAGSLLETPSFAGAEAAGIARVMVLRVYFDDYAATSRYTQAAVDGFFSDIDKLYQNTSYGNMSIDYQVSSLFEMPDNRSDYIDDYADGDLSNGGKFDKVLLDAIANAPAGLDWSDLDSIMVLMAETDSSQFHRGQGTSARTLPQGPGGANKTVGAAIFSENPSDTDRAVWGRMAHEVGHAFQGAGPAHPSNYNSEFELMDSNYPGQIGVFSKQSDMGYPGWMPPFKYQEFDAIGGGGIAQLYPMEYDPDMLPNVQAVRAKITDDLYYLVSVRRRILGDDLNAGFTPNGIPDEGVLIERVVVGGDPWVTLQPPPGGTRNNLWDAGQTYTNLADGIAIEVTRKSDPPDHYEIYVRYNPDVAHFPDVSMDPWTSPPGNTWETTDIWFDSPINGYDSYRYGTWNDLGGDPVPRINGDPPAVGLPNRVYARVRNVGTSTASNVKVHFEITNPMGVGIAGASGWALLGSTDSGDFPGLAAIAPGDYEDVWIEWTPDIDVPMEDIVDGLFNYHTCVRVKIDPVAGETVLANQDGDREQENISDFQVPEGGGGAPMMQIIRLRNDDTKNDQYFYLNYDASSLPAGWKVDVNGGKLGIMLKPNEVVEIPVLIDPTGPAPLGGVYGLSVMASRQVEYVNNLNPKDRHHHIEPLGGVTVTSRVLRKTDIDADAESHGPNEIEVRGKLLVEEFERFYDPKNPLRVMLIGLDANGKFIPETARVVPVRADQTFDGYLAGMEGGQPAAAMVLFAGTQLLATSAKGPLSLLGVDFGDAPEGMVAPLYPTKLWANGARHGIVKGFHLGATVDAEPDGQPNATATGDDISPAGVADDEDGVFFRSILAAGNWARVDVIASISGRLDAWMDFNTDGDWADPGEHIFISRALAGGVNHLSFLVPAHAKVGDTFARFRFSSTGRLSYVGAAPDGEVEDYRVRIRPGLLPDHFEPSGSLQTAIDIGYFGQSRTGLTLDDGDEDWFRWNALDSDTLTLELGSEEQLGNSVLEVYDAQGKLIASSEGSGNNQKVELEVAAGQHYYMRVYEVSGMIVGGYWLDWILAGKSKNYAVLYSGGVNAANNHDRYYNNTKELYEILRNTYGIPQDNIYVFFADGTNSAVDRSSGVNSDMSYATKVYSASPANLESVLVDTLTPLVDSNDHLFFWSFDHGGGTYNAPGTTGEEVINGWGGNVDDADIASWLDGVGAGYLTAVYTQCFAGGILDNMTLGSTEHGSAATNHYEYSWGDGFAAAYNDGLVAHRNAHDVYWYAYTHNPYATDGEGPGGSVANAVEHPWESSSNNFRIFAQKWTWFPWFEWVLPLKYNGLIPEKLISYDELLAASGVYDPEGNAIRFRIESIEDGTLLKNGRPVEPGKTTLGFGESLIWMAGDGQKEGTIEAFTVRAFNGAAISDSRLPVRIQYLEPGTPDLAIDDAIEINEDAESMVVPVLDNDKGTKPMSVSGIGAALHGTATLGDGIVFYVPDPEYSGEDHFTYYMADGTGRTDSAVVRIKVRAVNDHPDAFNDEFTVPAGASATPIDVLMNDFDAESKPFSWTPDAGPYGISAVVISSPMHGTISVDANGVLLYTPDAGYEGEDLFLYTAFDGIAHSGPARVTIHVVSDRTKWYQPPVYTDPDKPFRGWDEPTRYNGQQIVADDWVCTTDLPVTGIEWWGSFLGWRGDELPSHAPIGYQLGIWTDVPTSPNTLYSHPGRMIWQSLVSNPDVEFAGWELDPRDPRATPESVFLMSVDLKPAEWFWQDEREGIYWLSVAAVYPPDYTIEHPFGWTTRPRDPQSPAPDAAVRIYAPTAPTVGSAYLEGSPIYWPTTGTARQAWDMAFTLSTNPNLAADFGDAPDRPYPTLLVSNGAWHAFDPHDKTALRLGKLIDAETNGQPNADATGDDRSIIMMDDEDGVKFTSVLAAGRRAKVDVFASAPAILNAWIDFAANGSWAERIDHVFEDVALAAGWNTLSFMVPAAAKLGETFARFRLSTADGLNYAGRAPDGEVEDYMIRIRPAPLPDHFEPSSSIQTAVDLGIFGQLREGLTLDVEGDDDWYRWNALDSDRLTIDLNSEEQLGDMVLEVYDSFGKLIASSNEAGNEEQITLEVIAGSAYFIRVFELDSMIVPAYHLQWTLFGSSKNYAVLFSGGGNTSNNHDRYYNNTKELYEILRNTYGIPQDRIYVFFADGTNPAVDRSSGVNSDMSFALDTHVFAATAASLEDVLVDTLTPLVDANDHFFFWGFDHGGGSYNVPGTTGEEQLIGWGSNVNDEDMAEWLDDVGAGYLTVVHTQCFAGGMIDNMTLGGTEHASAATNHYEYSWGDGFASAYNDGLVAHRNAHDVYWYAYTHNPYATDGEGPGGAVGSSREHPWEVNSNNFRIFAQKWTLLPFIDKIYALEYRLPFPEPDPYRLITFDELLAAAEVFDAEGNAIRFRIESVLQGELLKNGRPVIPGVTTLGFNEELEWRPGGREAGETIVDAFTVRAFNGATISDLSLPVPIMLVEGVELAADDRITLLEDSGAVVVPVLDNDRGEKPLSVIGVGEALRGKVQFVDGVVRYTPGPEFSGEDQFTYYMTDGTGAVDSAVVQITVKPINDPPEAYGDEYFLPTGMRSYTLDVLANDFDVESKPLSFTASSGEYLITTVVHQAPAHGTLTQAANGTLVYTPFSAGFVGDDRFTYAASDGEDESDPVQVLIHIVPVAVEFTGSDAADTWYVRLDSTSTLVQVFESIPPGPVPTYTAPLDGIESISFNGLGGNDRLWISFINGSPIPAGGISYAGGAGTNEMILNDTAGSDKLEVGPATILHNGLSIGYDGVASPQLDSEAGDVIHLESLAVEAGAVLRAGFLGKVLRTSEVSISTDSRLDLGLGDMIVQATPDTRDAVFADVHGWVTSARNGGGLPWMGAGIGSLNAALNPLHTTGLATILVPTEGVQPALNGQAVDENSIVVKYTWTGDTNGDGWVSGADYFRLDHGFLTGGTIHQAGNVDYIGGVDGDDYFITDRAYLGQTVILSNSSPSAGTFNGTRPIEDRQAVAPQPARVPPLQPGDVFLQNRRTRQDRSAGLAQRDGDRIWRRDRDWIEDEDDILTGAAAQVF